MPPSWEFIRKPLYQKLGDPNSSDSVRLKQFSPLYHTANIKKPLLVLQGANDQNVLKIESDDIVDNVRKNGVPVEYIVFPDEGHGFRKRENQYKADEAVLKFLDMYVKTK
jgi:dipeptidyl aminopeptidase/acylaminoacyl peptidase